MSTEQVYMDIPAVRNTAQTLGGIGNVLDTVAKVLEVLSNTLKATAFVGLVGGAALAQLIDRIRPYIKQVADKCKELDKDVKASVDAYERGDARGATRFY